MKIPIFCNKNCMDFFVLYFLKYRLFYLKLILFFDTKVYTCMILVKSSIEKNSCIHIINATLDLDL